MFFLCRSAARAMSIRSLPSAVALLFALTLASSANAQNRPDAMPSATSTWTPDNGNGTFTNPLFQDEFSDPDIDPETGEPYSADWPGVAPDRRNGNVFV
jgi:hypothetical protein